VPGGERVEDWAEVPPGHFIAGKHARLQQFALTPEQLYQREVRALDRVQMLDILFAPGFQSMPSAFCRAMTSGKKKIG